MYGFEDNNYVQLCGLLEDYMEGFLVVFESSDFESSDLNPSMCLVMRPVPIKSRVGTLFGIGCANICRLFWSEESNWRNKVTVSPFAC